MEELLVGLFQEILGIEAIGVHDDFFECGGHSLFVTQLIARINRSLGLKLPLRALFEAPTAELLAAVIGTEMAARPSADAGPVGRAGRGSPIPLSYAQQRLWFLDHLEADHVPYNLPAAVSLSGCLDTSLLEAALRAVVARHEILRTTFEMQNGDPVQVIANSLDVSLPIIDLSAVPESERQREAGKVMKEEARRPFDLKHGPLLRPLLVRLGENRHILMLAMHHIITDAWSIGIILQEIGLLYEALLGNAPFPLDELPVQYADYSVWQRKWLTDAFLDEILRYWREVLAGISDLRLPFDRPRPALESFRGANHFLMMPRSLVNALKALSLEGVTLFITLLAAFRALLYHTTGDEDIAVGTMRAGRDQPELEGLIGFFANTMVLRARVAGNLKFRELLRREFDVALGAWAHQDVPFDRLVEELRPERNLSRNPLFQVMFILQNTPPTASAFGGLQLEPLVVDSGSVEFDLLLELYETGDGLTVRFAYSVDLFDAATIERLAANYRRMLEEVVADSDLSVDSISFLGEEDRTKLAQLFNERL
ncbi:MAG TPA: condensation domain-containing protein [Candidatus Kapabacteria bacterium]|nr:condensation domain-containing protein [Candidatus Kapabacteria bacterium]